MSTRYSAQDRHRAAQARTLAALVLIGGIFTLVAFVGAAIVPSAEPTLAAVPEAPIEPALPGA